MLKLPRKTPGRSWSAAHKFRAFIALQLARARRNRANSEGSLGSFSLSGLISHWRLDEAAGELRADAHGLNTLSATNSVDSASGKLGNAASFDDTLAQYLSVSAADLHTGAFDYTIVAWIRPAANTGGGNNHLISLSGDGALEFTIGSPPDGESIGFTYGDTSVTHPATLTLGEWYFVSAWFNNATGEIGIRVNDLAPEVDVVTTLPIPDETNSFLLGAINASAGFATSQLDSVSIFRGRLLSTEEIDFLYNSGTGRDYPFSA